MKEKIINIVQIVKNKIIELCSIQPLICGIIIGYFGSPFISVGIAIVGDIIKLAIKLI